MNKFEKKIRHKAGKAIHDFNLINENDKILVGLSGGKDSWVLLDILIKLRKSAPIDFDIFAIKINNNFKSGNDDEIIKKCHLMGVSLEIIDAPIDKIILEKKSDKDSYCSFCSRLRRGFIYGYANKINANVIALGHHREDANETLLMNLFFNGKLQSLPPKYLSDDNKYTIIRPLIYVGEDEIIEYSKEMNFPILLNNCPYESFNERAKIKKYITELSIDIPHIKNSLAAAQSNVSLSHLGDMRLFDFKNL
jgi:tRNA 2-thiocytidine biosynthesis protein TtcA